MPVYNADRRAEDYFYDRDGPRRIEHQHNRERAEDRSRDERQDQLHKDVREKLDDLCLLPIHSPRTRACKTFAAPAHPVNGWAAPYPRLRKPGRRRTLVRLPRMSTNPRCVGRAGTAPQPVAPECPRERPLPGADAPASEEPRRRRGRFRRRSAEGRWLRLPHAFGLRTDERGANQLAARILLMTPSTQSLEEEYRRKTSVPWVGSTTRYLMHGSSPMNRSVV